jgi:hypothetical protein
MPALAVFTIKHLRFVAALVLVGWLAAWGGGSSDPAPIDPQAQYAQAVTDAQVTLPSKISSHLPPINTQNRQLFCKPVSRQGVNYAIK